MTSGARIPKLAPSSLDDEQRSLYDAIAGGMKLVTFDAGRVVSHVSWVVTDLEQESARLARLGCRLINMAPACAPTSRPGSQFQDPRTMAVTLKNTFRWVAACR